MIDKLIPNKEETSYIRASVIRQIEIEEILQLDNKTHYQVRGIINKQETFLFGDWTDKDKALDYLHIINTQISEVRYE